jgi:hypothetical protein
MGKYLITLLLYARPKEMLAQQIFAMKIKSIDKKKKSTVT